MILCNCSKASDKRSLLIRERYSFRLGFSQLSNPPVWCQTHVFLQKSLHFTKRQSLLIYQTYQAAPQTDSARQFTILKIILYCSTLKSNMFPRVFSPCLDENLLILLPFSIFYRLDNLASKEKNVGHAAVSDIWP